MKIFVQALIAAGVFITSLFAATTAHAAPHLMESLGRGVVAVRTSGTEVFVSWRVLGTDPADVAFNLYRTAGGGAAVPLNAAPITGGTNFSDGTADLAQANAYFVRPIIGGIEQPASAAFTLSAGAPVQQYLRVPLQQPAAGAGYTYSPNDCSVGDLDGDGEYELIVKWDPSNAQDNSNGGVTGNVYLDGYKIDGTFLWRIDLGINIRAGAHYTQYLVYDFDGDGKAELVCKTAPGTRDGAGAFIAQAGKFVGTPSAPIDHNADYRNAGGYILTGPEFFTVFNGLTGAELATTNYVVPRNDNPASGDVTPWGDNYGNRVDRFLAGVAYLDGQRPSFVLARGYYTRAVLAAWDWRDGQLTQRWVFDTGQNGTTSPTAAWRGQGAHSLTVGDVDGDGRDEITYGASAIDDDGTGLYSTLLGHGDALHLSDMDPSRPGLEVYMVHEDPGSYGAAGSEFRDARTGALIFGVSGQGADVGRGVAGDVDPRYPGFEMWASRGGMMSANGTEISATKPAMNFMSWWDGDLLRETLDGTTIAKWDWTAGMSNVLLAPADVASNNGTKATPNLSADLFGDWREEVIWRETNNTALRIYTTTISTPHRIPTLMHDRQYRLAIAFQNVGYNQPPHPSFFLGDAMAPAPIPEIVTSLAQLPAVAPAVSSINRYDPVKPSTGATTVVFRVTFNAAVTGVDSADFAVTTTGSVLGSVGTVTPLSALAYNVVVTGVTGTGTLGLALSPGATINGPGGVPVAGGFSGGQTYSRATLAWINQASGGMWSNSANWDGGVIASGNTAVPIFGNYNVVSDTAVVLDGPRTLAGIRFEDTDPASAASWTVNDAGNVANVLTFDTESGVPTVTVGALGTGSTATLDVTLAGGDGFAKAGAGTLVVTKPADLTGLINVAAGTLRLAAGSEIAATTVNVAAGTGRLEVTGGALSASGATTVNGGGGTFVLNEGTVTLAAVATNNSANGLIRINGGDFSATSINVPRSSDGTPSFAYGFVVTGGASTVSGTVGIGTNNSWGSMSVEGGALTVGGPISIGNQASAGRGGQLRVTGGTFVATDATEGLVINRRAGNVARANFTGGVTTVEKIALGFNASVNAGSATLTLDGGALYVGSGGIASAGTGTFVPAINLQSGVLGAKAAWTTAMPITLVSGGNIAVKTADLADEPQDITLTGVLSGAGGLTKTGAGTLTLAGENTYTGTTTLSAGTLRVDGSLAAASMVIINGGALAGTGTVNGPVVLNEVGALVLGGSAAATQFNASALTWNGGGAVAFRLGASGSSDRLVLNGALTRGQAGVFAIALTAGEGFAPGNLYTLATFTSTNFTADDFVATGLPPGYGATFTVTGTSLSVTIVATPVITSATNATGDVGVPFNYAITADNQPTSFSATGLPAGLSLDSTTGIISGTPSASGNFTVTLGATNAAGTGTASLTLTVAPASALVTLGDLQQAYDGTPRAVTITTTPSGLSVTVTYNGSVTPPTLPGTYAVVATVEDAGYAGTVQGTLVIKAAALVRHAPTINGDVDGSVQVLLPESVTLNGSSYISGDLLLPGTPKVKLNGSPMLGGTQEGTGAAAPATHTVTLNGNAVLRYLVRRIDPITMPVVAAPQAPTGTRDVSVNNATQAIGDFSTLRNLTLNGNAGTRAIPPGAYGHLTANGASKFVFGVVGATEPTVYHLQSLTLNGTSAVQIVGPVILKLANGPALNGNLGASGVPEWLVVEIFNGGLTLNGNSSLSGEVVAPNGTVILNGNSTLMGNVSADRLTINGNGLLEQPGN